ncbi:hypothetical protein C8R48DRAFT_672816 [Suillus tomentosus]|nr:hypothetical protein C8R48DRAFT_672816 [Suillus tomentosus]
MADYIVLNSLQYQAYGHQVTHATPYQLLYSICSHFSLHAGHSHDRHLPIGSLILPNDVREIRSPCLVVFGQSNKAGALLPHYQSVLLAHLNLSSSPPLFECNFRNLEQAVAQLRATLDAHNAAHMESAPPSTDILGPFCMPLTIGQAADNTITADLPLVQVANGNLSPSLPQSPLPLPVPSLPSSLPFLHLGDWYIPPNATLLDFSVGGSQSGGGGTYYTGPADVVPPLVPFAINHHFYPQQFASNLRPPLLQVSEQQKLQNYSSDDNIFNEEPVLVLPPSAMIDTLCELLVANDIKECIGHLMSSLVCVFSFDYLIP